jgi:hypothetical protein
VIVALALTACAQWPRTRDPSVFLAAPVGSKVVRFEGVVPVPFSTAYRNIYRAARGCWARSSALGLFAPPIVVEGDSDPERREGLVQVSELGGDIFAVVKLNGSGEGTRISAAAVDTSGLPGSPEIPLLPKWAAGEPTECKTQRALI